MNQRAFARPVLRVMMLASVLTLALAACGGPQAPQGPNGPKPPGEGTATLPTTTKVLDDTALSTLTNVSQDGDFVFSSSTPTLAALAIGDVFIAGISAKTPMGALRRVDAMSPQGSGVILQSSPARLQDAFEDLDFELQTKIIAASEAQGLKEQGLKAQGLYSQADGLSFPLDLKASDEDGSVELSGAVSLAPTFDLTFDFDITSFELDELTMEFGAEQTLLANLTGSGHVAFDESITLGTIPFEPILFTLPTPAGPVPLVITPAVVIEAGLSGSVAGNFEASVNQEASFTAGVGFQDGRFGGFWDGDSDLQFEQPAYAAAAAVRASVGPRLEVLLYGAIGPYAAVEGYVEASAHVDNPPLCVRGALNAGLTATAGVTLLIDEYVTTLLNEVVPLASFDSCDPNAPRPAATWARSFGRAGSSGEEAAAIVEASDGSLLVVGNSGLFDGITGSGASLWALRLDPLGNVLWQRAYSGLYIGGLAEAATEVPGGFVIATRQGLIAIDTGGNVLWSKNYAAGQFFEILSLATSTDNGLLVAGRYGDSPAAWAAKLDAQGDVSWSRTYAGSTFARAIATADGGHALLGSSDANDGDAYLVKLDPNGDLAWQRSIDDKYDQHGGEGDPIVLPGTDGGFDIAELTGGGYVVVGYSYGAFPNPEANPAGHFEAWEVELAADGELVSSTVHRAPSGAVNDVAQAVVVKGDGGTVVLGMQADDAGDMYVSEDLLVIQGGAYSVIGGGGNDTLNPDSGASAAGAATATSDGGLIVAATSDTFGANEQLWLIKLGRTANINFPYKTNPAGSSYENPEAVSLELGAGTQNAPLSAAATGPIEWESTEMTGVWQAP